MIKLYLTLIVLAVLALVGAGAVWYYNDTQQRIATLRENNAKLEVAIATSEESLKTLQQDIVKFQELNTQLQSDLQKAEAYGDDLRAKLREHNLTALAIKKPGLLEGKMNGATAKLWRDITADTGGTPSDTLPKWLQSSPVEQSTRSQDGSSDQGRENNNTDGSTPEASSVN
jgi:type II secretory pathway pseudopilin PulG